MNKIAELLRVLDEEDGCVVTHQVPVAVFGIKLNGKAAGIPFRIGTAFFTAHSRKTYQHFCAFANGAEQFGLCVF